MGSFDPFGGLDAPDDLGGHATPPSVNDLPQGKGVRSRGYRPPWAVSGAPREVVGCSWAPPGEGPAAWPPWVRSQSGRCGPPAHFGRQPDKRIKEGLMGLMPGVCKRPGLQLTGKIGGPGQN